MLRRLVNGCTAVRQAHVVQNPKTGACSSSGLVTSKTELVQVLVSTRRFAQSRCHLPLTARYS